MSTTIQFSSEQVELRRTVRSFLDKRSTESEVRRLMDDGPGYDPTVWSLMADQLGLNGLAIPEQYGGSGFGFTEQAIVLEEMGRCLLVAPYFSATVLAANALLLSGDEHAKETFLPTIASGTTIATLATTEASGQLGQDGIHATASNDGGTWRVTGRKSFVLDGHTANLLIVAANTQRGLSLFAVFGDAQGLDRVALPTLDATRKLARVDFVETPATLIGTEGGAWPILERVFDRAAVALAAEQVGGAQAVLDMILEYVKIRHQFGRAIGSFQAIKHQCADLHLDVESARSAAYYASRCVDEAPDELPAVAALTKAYCSEAYFKVAAANIQLHGGIGFTWEHPAHLYFRRAKSSELLLGDGDFWYGLLAERIGI